jgi:hypothetical protein
MTRIRLWHTAIVALASLAFHAASADEIKLKYRLLDKGSAVEVDVPEEAEALAWQKRDSSTKTWNEYSSIPVTGPVENLRISSPVSAARKADWRLVAKSSSAQPAFPASFFEGSRVFPGVSLEEYDKQQAPLYSTPWTLDTTFIGDSEVQLRSFGSLLLTFNRHRGISLIDFSNPSHPVRKGSIGVYELLSTYPSREFVFLPGGNPAKPCFLVIGYSPSQVMGPTGTTIVPFTADLEDGTIAIHNPIKLNGEFAGVATGPDTACVMVSTKAVVFDSRNAGDPFSRFIDYPQSKRIIALDGGYAAVASASMNDFGVTIVKLAGGSFEEYCRFSTGNYCRSLSLVGGTLGTYSRWNSDAILETFAFPASAQSAPISRTGFCSLPNNAEPVRHSGTVWIGKNYSTNAWTVGSSNVAEAPQAVSLATDVGEVIMAAYPAGNSHVIAFSTKQEKSFALLYEIGAQNSIQPSERLPIRATFKQGASRPLSYAVSGSALVGVIDVDGQSQLFKVGGTPAQPHLVVADITSPEDAGLTFTSLEGSGTSRLIGTAKGVLREYSLSEAMDLSYLSQLRVAWSVDGVCTAPGHLLQFDKTTSRVIVTSDQTPDLPLSENDLGKGEVLHQSITDGKLHVLRLENHMQSEGRLLGATETWPENFNRDLAPIYHWDTYDLSALPNLVLAESLSIDLDLSADMKNLLQRGEVEASVAWPLPGVAAILVDHQAWIVSNLASLPPAIRAPAAGEIFATVDPAFLKQSKINKILKDPFQTMFDVGAGGQHYKRPSSGGSGGYLGAGATLNIGYAGYSLYLGTTPTLKVSQRRSCPVFFVIDSRNQSPAHVSDLLLLGDRRTIQTTSLYSTTGAVALGFDSLESPTVVSSKYVKVREARTANVVRSYLQVIDIGAEGAPSLRSRIDLPGSLKSITEFTPRSGLLWTKSKGLAGDDLQVSAFSGADAFLLSVVRNISADSFAALGRKGFANYSSQIRQYELDGSGVLANNTTASVPFALSLGFQTFGDRAFAWIKETDQSKYPKTLRSLTLNSLPNMEAEWTFDRPVKVGSPFTQGDGFLAIANGLFGVEVLSEE